MREGHVAEGRISTHAFLLGPTNGWIVPNKLSPVLHLMIIYVVTLALQFVDCLVDCINPSCPSDHTQQIASNTIYKRSTWI